MNWFRGESKPDKYARTAIATFARLAPSAPVIDEAQLRGEHESLSSSWRGPVLITGSLDYITVVVQENILRDASRADYGVTAVNVLDANSSISGQFGVPRRRRPRPRLSRLANTRTGRAVQQLPGHDHA